MRRRDRAWESGGVDVGVDSFAAVVTDPDTGAVVESAERMAHLLEEIELADRVGLASYGIGEHHRVEYYDAAPAVILAAAAARTSQIRLRSAVTVLSAADPVRVFQEFATVDLISGGRVELVVGRGSFTEAFPLFGLDLADYDELFDEKLDLLLRLREDTEITWSGRHRPPLVRQRVYPRPVQDPLPVWIGVGGTPESFIRSGLLGLPLMVAIIGGETHRFRPLIDLYKKAGVQAGYSADRLKVGVHSLGYVAESTQEAVDDFYPGYARTMNEIGKERGWPKITRESFDTQRGSKGSLLVGDPDE